MKKFLLTFSVAIVAILGLQSCEGSSKESKQTGEAKKEAEASEEAETYIVNPIDSKIKWTGKTMVSNHFGSILFKNGEIALKEGSLESGSFIVNVSSIKTEDIEEEAMAIELDEHLKSANFFDVTNFPESKFTITSVKPLKGEFNSELEGNLELKGISKNITIKANVEVKGDKVTLATEKFTINRQDFQITYTNGGAKDKVINDLLDLEITLTADKK